MLCRLVTVVIVFITATLCPAYTHADEVRIGFTVDALSLDPANHRKRETETIIRNMYDGLLTRSPRMEVVQEIAVSWRLIDKLTFDFTLRKGVKFHNGDELTAEDVRFSLHRIAHDGGMGGGRTSPRKSLFPVLKEVEIIDAYTVRLHLSEPWPFLLSMLPLQQIVSQSFVKGKGLQGIDDAVNGTGPFKLVEWRRGEAVIMERFEDYYGGSFDVPPVGPACVDRAIFKIMPKNLTRVSALLNGEVDIINDLSPKDIAAVDANPNTHVMKSAGTRTFFIALNMTKPPFNDARVRQAANFTVDREVIIRKQLNGTATIVNGVLSPYAFAYNRNLPTYEFAPEKSRMLLADAGYPNGLNVTLEVDPSSVDLAYAIADSLEKGGFLVNVSIASILDLKAKWWTAKEKTGDMWLTSWGNSSLNPAGIFDPTLRSGGRGNASGYSNPEVDQRIDAARTAFNRAEQAKLYEEAQVIVNAEMPWVFLWVPEDIYGVSKRVRNWRPSPDGRINLHDVCVN